MNDNKKPLKTPNFSYHSHSLRHQVHLVKFHFMDIGQKEDFVTREMTFALLRALGVLFWMWSASETFNFKFYILGFIYVTFSILIYIYPLFLHYLYTFCLNVLIIYAYLSFILLNIVLKIIDLYKVEQPKIYNSHNSGCVMLYTLSFKSLL